LRRAILILAAAVTLAVPGMALLPAPALAANAATVSYAPGMSTHVFHETHPMAGGAPAGTIQIICNTNPNACDTVDITTNVMRNGSVDHGALLTLKLVTSAGSSMRMAQLPDGCSESNVTQACAPYLSNPVTFSDPGNATLHLVVVCSSCTAGTYALTATLTHVDLVPALPNPGSPTPAFVTTPLIDPTPPAGLAGTAPGQLTGQYGEPGLWINRKGVGIVNSFGPTVWITRDGGKTFTAPTDIIGNDTYCQTRYAGDADAVVGIDNTFYADNLCLGNQGAVNNESFTNATGDPAAWGAPHLAGGESDRQWYVPDPVDPNVLYFSFHSFTPGLDVNVFKSTDKGATFFCPETGVPVTPATSAGPNCPVTATSNSSSIPVNTTYLDTGAGNVTTRPMIDPHEPQTIYVPYADTHACDALTAPPNRPDSDLTRFRLAVSHDGGKTWAANADPTGQGVVFDSEDGKYFPITNTGCPGTDDSTIAHIFIGATVDSAGNLYILFSLRIGKTTPTHLYMMSSRNGGTTWSAPHRVDSDGLGSNVFPTIKAGDPGRVAMAWYGSKSSDYNDTKALWGEMFAQSTNALDPNPTFTQTRVSGDLPVHAADICQAGTFCAITGGNRNLADYQTVDTDPCGKAVIVYTDDHAPQAHTVISRQTAGASLFNRGCAGPQSFLHQPTTVSTAGGGTPTTSRAPTAPPLSALLALVLAALAALVVLRGSRAGDG
jgi:hypothetical protein